jgi:hypothetical protein
LGKDIVIVSSKDCAECSGIHQDKLSIFVKGNAVKNANVNAASSIEITLSWSKQKYDLKGGLHLQSVWCLLQKRSSNYSCLGSLGSDNNLISCDHRHLIKYTD